MWITLWRTVTIISRLSDTYVHRLLMKLLRWWLVLLLALELITVTHYFTEWLTGIWISYSVYKTEQPELFVVLEVSTHLLHSNFITYIGYRCAAESSLNCQHCFRSGTLNQPQYLSNILGQHPYQPTRLLRSSTQDLLTVPRCKTVFGGRRFSIAAPRVWNSLPQDLIETVILQALFKNILRLTYSARTLSSQPPTRLRLRFYKLNPGAI